MSLNLKNILSKEIMPGYHGKLVHTENMTLVFWDVEKDAVVHEHHHMHEQIMHVFEGEFELTVDGETKVYHAGDIVPIGSDVPHSGKALTPCRLMDVFSPARNEYR